MPLSGLPVAFSLDGKKIASRDANVISIDNLEPFKEERHLRVDDRDLVPASIAFSRDDTWVAAGFNDGTVRIWSLP